MAAPLHAEVLFYAAREAIRNAARHGHGPDGSGDTALHLRVGAQQNTDQLELTIAANGIGPPAPPGLCQPPLSPSAKSQFTPPPRSSPQRCMRPG